ncbi:MAG TPA: hypothetical protein PLD37_00680 [Usitatibacteraceae bacterium]|nr:hypothetical protein [Usitatibacteraceae bacterium]
MSDTIWVRRKSRVGADASGDDFDPSDALPAMRKIVERLKAGEVKGIKEKVRPQLLEELEDCLAKVAEAEREKDQFHFCIVM